MFQNSVIDQFSNIIKKGKKQVEEIINRNSVPNVQISEKIVPIQDVKTIENCDNTLINGDNLSVMEFLFKNGMRGKIDLIYIDPPFFTKTYYNNKIVLPMNDKKIVIEQRAYSDIWKKGIISYLEMMYPRLCFMKELLSNKGSIYVHLDWHVVHYVKIIMDEIFGQENFLNEIIWSYKSGGVSKKYFSRKHDTILFYSKTKNYIFNPQKQKSYNRQFKPYRFKGVKEYQDKLGWYTLVNMKDVWNVDMVGRTSKERVGYGTQKPENLLKTIILSSTNENSIVADFFAGSGTTGIVAEKLNRRWIMSDIGKPACLVMRKRFANNKCNQFLFRKIITNYKNDIKKSNLSTKPIKKLNLNNDKEILIIELEQYKYYDINNLNIKEKDKKIVEDILENRSLKLIDYISIDTDYDGKTFISRWQNYNNVAYQNNISSKIKLTVSKKQGKRKVKIKVVDIFGIETNVQQEV